MKKLIAVMAVLFSVNAGAFTGNGNERIDDAREYLRYKNGGQNINWAATSRWSGIVSAMADIFSRDAFKYPICYPKEANVGQISEIAANYLVNHPEERADSTFLLIHSAHLEAFGRKHDEDCEEY